MMLYAEQILLENSSNILQVDVNSLTLDTCRLRVEDGEWTPQQPLVLIQEQLLALGRPVHIEIEFEFEFQVELDASFRVNYIWS
jgi:hypothetical protein